MISYDTIRYVLQHEKIIWVLLCDKRTFDAMCRSFSIDSAKELCIRNVRGRAKQYVQLNRNNVKRYNNTEVVRTSCSIDSAKEVCARARAPVCVFRSV